jgi:hypothetical protein
MSDNPSKLVNDFEALYTSVSMLREVVLDYDRKRPGSIDVKTMFSLTDAQVESGLKQRLKPRVNAVRTALQTLVSDLQAIDSTI